MFTILYVFYSKYVELVDLTDEISPSEDNDSDIVSCPPVVSPNPILTRYRVCLIFYL